jgi:hypothetical protein
MINESNLEENLDSLERGFIDYLPLYKHDQLAELIDQLRILCSTTIDDFDSIRGADLILGSGVEMPKLK